jgi:ribosomal protein L11 methyltransferase
MDYQGLIFKISPLFPARDILTARLAEIGFESFVESEDGLEAYIPQSDYNKEEVLKIQELNSNEWSISFEEKSFEDQNWNATWEATFQAIEVGDFVRVRAPFHEEKQGFRHEVLIQPQMSFGTGHHQTTYLIMKNMADLDYKEKEVLDMGCGTGILAILAEKLGAKKIDAIDIDPWSFQNTQENIELNSSKQIQAILGGVEAIPDRKYDVIIANINRNILQAQLPRYAEAMKVGASLYLSGFFETDVPVLQEQAASLGIQMIKVDDKEGWAMYLGEKVTE